MKLLETRFLASGCLVASLLFAAESAQSLPSLQLGAGAGDWFYDTATQTWITDDDPLQLLATANATRAQGGNGAYAWTRTTSPRTAYLVVAAVSDTTLSADVFDITVLNDAEALSVYESGYGVPPEGDPIAPHGIYPTYYEIYRFTFDGSRVTISDTQPGQTGTGIGYVELFDIDLHSLAASVDSLHFDLYTTLAEAEDRVYRIAPYSHDGGTDAGTTPEPRSTLLFAVGSVIAGVSLHRRR